MTPKAGSETEPPTRLSVAVSAARNAVVLRIDPVPRNACRPRRDEKVAEVLGHGADHAINRRTASYVDAVGAIAGKKPAGFAPWAPPAGVHVVLNGVGGPTLDTDRRIIRRLGRWVLFGTVAGVRPINAFESSYDSISILPFFMIPFSWTGAMDRANEFTEEWLRTEPLVRPTVHPIEDVAAVQAAMEAGDTSGKVVFQL